MLLLYFQANEQAYALEISCVEEIIPLVELRALPGAPDGVSGLLNYRGTVIPAVDLSRWMGGPAARNRLSTRMAILRVETVQGVFRLALLLEGATETKTIDPSAIKPSRVIHEKIPCLGDVFVEQENMVQLIDPQRLLTDRLKTIITSEENEP